MSDLDDDLLFGSLANEFDSAIQSEPTATDRVEIELTTREHDVNDAVITALSADGSLFQRGGQLVIVINGDLSSESVSRPDNAPRVAALPVASLREKISRYVDFVAVDEDKQKTNRHVPDWCSKAVFARGEWQRIRPLNGIINHPIIRPDGSILTKPGYDHQTGLILHWIGEPLDVPLNPSRADAMDAVKRLKRLVGDFPFESECHRSGWLAFLLTALIRHAFTHAITCPLFLIDASVRGSGKTLLADLIGMIICGFALPRMIFSKDDEEVRKHMLCLAMSGDELVLFDNVAGDLGGQTLDAVLTGTTFRGRILGESREVSVAINCTFAATANNCSITGDLCRRAIPIRLSSPLENPEERDDFQVPNLLQYVQANRNQFLIDALTIERAFVVAQKPDIGLSAMGSFEHWSSMVRAPLVWVGEPDPWDARTEFAKRVDTGVQTLGEILRNWETIDPDDDGCTVAELLQRIESMPQYYSAFKSAICDLCSCKPGMMPTSRTLGKRLGSFRDRVYRGQRLTSKENRDGVMVWRVESAESRVRGLRGNEGINHTYPTREKSDVDSYSYETRAEMTPQSQQTPQKVTYDSGAALFEGSF